MSSFLRAMTATCVGLAGTALLVRDRAAQAERANPPLGRFIEVAGVTLHFVDRGQGRPVVLLHGNGAMINDLLISGLVDDLAHGNRVIAFDRPGFGYTTRPRGRSWTASDQAGLVARALAKLGIESVTVLGHSWGALVALALAIEHRRLVDALVLASGSYFPTARADQLLFAPPSIPLLGTIVRNTIAMPLGALMTRPLIERMFAPQGVPEAFKRDFPIALTLRPSQIRAFSEETSRMSEEARRLAPFYSSVSCPTTILAGDQDRIVQVTQSQRLHDVIPNSHLEVLSGSGHMLHHVERTRVAAAVKAAAHAKAVMAQAH